MKHCNGLFGVSFKENVMTDITTESVYCSFFLSSPQEIKEDAFYETFNR